MIPVKRCDRGSVATLQEWSDKLADMVLAPSVAGLFKWRQFEPEVILLAVGWYLRFSLSYHDVAKLISSADARSISPAYQVKPPNLQHFRCERVEVIEDFAG